MSAGGNGTGVFFRHEQRRERPQSTPSLAQHPDEAEHITKKVKGFSLN